MCGKDCELPRQPCGYLADLRQHLDDFCVGRAPVMCSVHVLHLRSGTCRFELLTLPTGGDAGSLTKEDEIFLKIAPTAFVAAGAEVLTYGRVQEIP